MSSPESFFDSIKKWFSSEAAEARKVKDDVSERLDHDLARRERELEATPEERLQNIQEQIDDGDSAFDDIRTKIDASSAQVELDAAEADKPAGGTHTDPRQ